MYKFIVSANSPGENYPHTKQRFQSFHSFQYGDYPTPPLPVTRHRTAAQRLPSGPYNRRLPIFDSPSPLRPSQRAPAQRRVTVRGRRDFQARLSAVARHTGHGRVRTPGLPSHSSALLSPDNDQLCRGCASARATARVCSPASARFLVGSFRPPAGVLLVSGQIDPKPMTSSAQPGLLRPAPASVIVRPAPATPPGGGTTPLRLPPASAMLCR